MKKKISLNGIRMHVTETAEHGVVSTETYFDFKQEGEVVTAQYSGGDIRLGYLAGVLSEKNLDFQYSQMQNDGHIDRGKSNCKVSRTADGGIRLEEHFQWTTREGSGVNVFEEVKS